MKRESATSHVAAAMGDGWIQGGSFLGSILSGTLLGYLADMWLGTEPWLVVTGIVVGSYSGFLNVWRQSKRAEEAGRES
ncbi:MAG TPA: AtpZ/AtpI family protein [Acidimicrobiia bacterium]|nr:AtpZ/AtpI family protein [Acidimicrobiia bacterium]